MTITFKPAARENVNLLIGLAGGTGSGKTYSAMRMASGIAADKRFAVIDTENGRASHYADEFPFDVAELRTPFSPAAYADAILSADAAGYPVIVVDSMSHVWAGDGGVLDMQEAEFQRMGAREAVKMASWIRPKMAHKQMVQQLLQVKAHLILCFRAEPKIEVAKDEKGKTVIVPKHTLTGLDGWVPVSDKNLPFELTVSFLLTADAPGMPKPIKLQASHRALFPLDKPINEFSGKSVAEWAAGGTIRSDPLPQAVLDAFAPYGKDLAALSAWLDHDATAADTDKLRDHLRDLKRSPRQEVAFGFTQVSGRPETGFQTGVAFDEHAFAAKLRNCTDREVLALQADSLRDVKDDSVRARLTTVYLERDEQLSLT